MADLTAKHFTDETAARLMIEGLRWPTGPVCGHCGETQRRYETKREGRYRCGARTCRRDFTVTTGTVMESSHVPLHKWLMGFHLVSASKKGISAHQLHRMLKITYKSAWFLHHRIREAMWAGGLLPPLGGAGAVVEADETYFGKTAEDRHSPQRGDRPYTKSGKSGPRNKRAIVSLVERGGNVRSFHVDTANKAIVTKIIAENVARGSELNTDESNLYGDAKDYVVAHATVKHSAKEYARREGERVVHTNTIEGYFSIFKRGMKGVYQHCAEKHLHRYLAEFDFRYNNRIALGVDDETRAALAVKGAVGKRLTYRQPN